MTFAAITPALMVGAFCERMKLSAVIVFSALWLLVVYVPICHMTWGGAGGYFCDQGVSDLAGGIVVHVTAGSAALVACIMVGKRKGYPKQILPPHNLTMTVTGTCMLWVGWFGFNAGSGLAANGSAAMTLLVTHLSACTATLVWMLVEWIKSEKLECWAPQQVRLPVWYALYFQPQSNQSLVTTIRLKFLAFKASVGFWGR